MYFQDLILALQEFWAKRGCLIVQPYNSRGRRRHVQPGDVPARARARAVERGVRRALAPPGRRPLRRQPEPHCSSFTSSRSSSSRRPLDIQDLYLESLRALGTKPEDHDVRFVEDDWESPTLGAWGLGWQVWLDGLEISQFTYFQQVGGIDCRPVSGELTYGLERIACTCRTWSSSTTCLWAPGVALRRARASAREWEWSTYNFEQADVAAHFAAFDHVRERRRSGSSRSGGDGSEEEARPPGVRLRREGARTRSTCSTRAAPSASPSGSASSAACAGWPRASPRRTSRSERRSAFRSCLVTGGARGSGERRGRDRARRDHARRGGHRGVWRWWRREGLEVSEAPRRLRRHPLPRHPGGTERQHRIRPRCVRRERRAR